MEVIFQWFQDLSLSSWRLLDPISRIDHKYILLPGFLLLTTGLLLRLLRLLRLLLLFVGELLKLEPLLLAHGLRRELGLCRSHPQWHTREHKTLTMAAQLVPKANGKGQYGEGGAGNTGGGGGGCEYVEDGEVPFINLKRGYKSRGGLLDSFRLSCRNFREPLICMHTPIFANRTPRFVSRTPGRSNKL